MKIKVKLQGLDCPNCAKNLEREISKIDGITFAEIDFTKSQLVYESNKNDIFNEIYKLAKTIEPDIILTKNGEKTKKNNKKFIFDVIFLVLGLILGAIIYFVKMDKIIYYILFFLSILLLGYKTYYKAVVLLFKGKINENLLVTISVFGAFLVNEQMEAIMVIALYSIGKLLEKIAVEKTRKNISSLTALQVDSVCLLDGDKEKTSEPEQVKEGSLILVKVGEKVAIDGIVVKGSASLNVQSLTGESLPKYVSEGDEVLSGSISLDGAIIIKTTTTYSNSTVSKILSLIETAQDKKSKTETFISKITKWYTLGVIISAILVFGITMLVLNDFNTAIYRGLIFLVVSCPCAFAISVPLAYFSGLGNASKKGILIKGSQYLDACANLKKIAFDKTGTITSGNLKLEKIEIFNKNYTEKDILFLASLGERYSVHPIAKAIVMSNKTQLEDAENVKEVAGEGVYFTYKNENYFIGRKEKNISFTIAQLYKEDEKLADIILSDNIKESSFNAFKKLKQQNIQTILLSGDNKDSVEKIAKQLEITHYKYGLLPQDKFSYLEKFKGKDLIGFVGDGINDAPSLAFSDVGFSMGINGSSASIETADIVITDDNLEKVPLSIKISKFTRKIVWQNIILAAVIKLTFLLLGALGVTGMLVAVFADVGVTLLAILNSIRALVYSPKER